jgi:hypothetical protein
LLKFFTNIYCFFIFCFPVTKTLIIYVAAWLLGPGEEALLGCGIALGLFVAQTVVSWLAVRQARIRIPPPHPKEVPPTELTAMKKWRQASANVKE